MQKTVDIIIPVYQGFQETIDCILSVFKTQSQNKTVFNVIVIDDCSPDQALSLQLVDLAKTHGFTLLVNEVNLGFVATVNRGMSETQNDVVLLNSDTEVVGTWLDKLVFHGSQENIASVTPFSNNATICSYPVFCAKNPIADGETVESLDQYFQQANHQESIQIPTAVGFCMYIPRHALDKVGLFDVESFGKGYGEENDFCRRAKKLGLQNIMALDTFVMHEGGISFAEMQQTFQMAGSKALNKKHPEYDALIKEFVRADPSRSHRRKIDLLRIRHSKKPTVLLVSHALGGGTQKHTKDIADLFYGQANILEISPYDNSFFRLSWSADLEEFELFFTKKQFTDLFDCLVLLAIDRVHFQHVLGLPDELTGLGEHAGLAKHLGVAYDVTLHDYYFACLNVHLNNTEGRYCGEPLKGGEDHHCACLKEPDRQAKHIAKWQPFLEQAERVFAPSHDLKNRFLTYYPKINPIFAPHCEKEILISKLNTRPKSPKRTRIMLLGALSQLKGADIFESVVAMAKQSSQLDFHLVGFTYTRIETSANVKVYGAYKDCDLPVLIEDISPDLFWFVSVAPETYSYTLSYAMASNLPIAATDIGAIAERLQSYPKAWLLPYQTSAEEWFAFFKNYKEKPYLSVKEPYPLMWSYLNDYLIDIDKKNLPFNEALLGYAANCRPKVAWDLKDPKLMLVTALLNIRKNKIVGYLIRKVPEKQKVKLKNWLLGRK